jgi:hypothetical protein
MGNIASSFAAEKSAGIDPPQNEMSSYDSDSLVTEDAQEGIKKVEAIASTWTKKELYIAYVGYVFWFSLVL